MGQDIWRIVGWSAAAIGALFVLAIVVYWTRRWIMRRSDESSGPVFTLQDLREMRDAGLILPEEYEKMRAGILAAATPANDPVALPRDPNVRRPAE